MCDKGKRVALFCFFLCVLAKNGLSLQSEVLSVKRMATESDESTCHPEQVHISYSSSPSEMTVMWSTKGACDTLVQYAHRPWDLNLEAAGTFIELDYAFNNSFRFIHRTVLKELLPDTTYYFRPHMAVGIREAYFFFKTPVTNNESCSSNFLVLSSMDSKGSTLKHLIHEAQSGKYNAVLFNGDLEERLTPADDQGDEDFLSNLEQVAGFVPFMTAPGRKGTSSNDGLYQYSHSFSMPGIDWPMPASKMWYSFDVGPVHIISYSTDVFFESDTKNAKAQVDGIFNDLKEANRRRAETPWIIAIGSHPMYCSFGVLDVDDCAQNMSKVRHGLEDMFYLFAVDLVIEARHTMYERTWPKYKGVIITKSYVNPRAPVEVIIGSDVDWKGVSPTTSDPNATAPAAAEWSAFHLEAVNCFGNLSVVNSSHLQWELISSADHSTLDSFWIVQDSHGNFSLANLSLNIRHQINQSIIAMGGKPGTYDFISGSTGSESYVEGWSEYSLWLGLAVVGAILMAIIGMVAVRSCMRRRRRARAGRRWREVDRDGSGGGNFYSVASESDTDDNDFEIDVYEKANKQSSKLLTSY